MQDVQALPRSSMIEAWRERAPVAIVIAIGLLLAAGLLALIWIVVHGRDPAPSEPKIIHLLLTPPVPPQRPPEPARETIERPHAPPPVPVPPKKPAEQRRDSVAVAPTPKPKPAPPQPKAAASAVADPMSLDAPPDWRQFALPQGPNAGNVIGGNGENGGGSGCGAGTYMAILRSQLRNVFVRNEKVDTRAFRIQARLWFDDLGAVQRAELLHSTGKPDLDASIRTVLGQINVGRGMPQCIQPVTVWVSQPWDGSFAGSGQNDAMPGDVPMEVWQTRGRPGN